jgi:hypothetical protein
VPLVNPTLGLAFPSSRIESAASHEPVRINPETWMKYESVARCGRPPSRLSREYLVDARRELDVSSDEAVNRLFVLTMMWGSGTSNGRGPRNTQAALEAPDAVDVLRQSVEFVAAGDLARAYDLHRNLRQVGPSFHTKWLWVLGATAEVRPRPLVMDKLVWNALGALGWDSRLAAGGNRRWSARYLAYREACEQWAADARCDPEDIEYSLFKWGRNA